MPLPRYIPGSGHLGDAQPIADEVGGLYNKGADAVNHPMNTIRGMLGMNQPPTQHGADPGMVREANESFIHPTPNPVVAPPRRKPMNQGY